MTVADIVKVTQYLTRADDIAAYAKVRSRFLGQVRPSVDAGRRAAARLA